MKAFSLAYRLPPQERCIFETLDEVSDEASSKGLSTELCYSLRLALEELLLNVLHHNSLHPEDEIAVSISWTEQELTLEISDPGTTFDPNLAPTPDLESPLEDRPIGGLGIHLVRKTSDEFSFKRSGDRNVVRVRWAAKK